MHKRATRRRAIRLLATFAGLAMLLFYLAWNAWWLSHQRLAPALLTAATGLPAPTTGGTRSALQLLNGDVQGSLYYNPMTVPILVLLCATLYQVARYGRAAAWMAHAWVLLLLIAWVVKLCSPPDTW